MKIYKNIYFLIIVSFIQEQFQLVYPQDMCNGRYIETHHKSFSFCKEQCARVEAEENISNALICNEECLTRLVGEQNIDGEILQYFACTQKMVQQQDQAILSSNLSSSLEKINVTEHKGLLNKKIVLNPAYIARNAGEPAVKQYFQKKGYKNLHSSSDSPHNYYLHFSFRENKVNMNAFKEGKQLVNSIQNHKTLSSKVGLVNTLRKYDKMQNKTQNSYSSTDFFPDTYIINLAIKNMTQEEKKIQKINSTDWWLLKPNNGFGGEGIQIVKNLKTFQKNMPSLKKLGSKQQYVMQRYMMNPLLLDKKKFDLRYFVVVPSTKPFFAVLYKGFIRKSMFDFILNRNNKKDDFRHITNVKLQRKHKDYQRMKNESIWLFDKFDDYLGKKFEKSQIDEMYSKMKKSISYTLQAGKQRFNMKQGMFQFFAFDFMINENLEPQLIEVNGNPSWATSNAIYKKLKVELLENMLDLVLFLHKDPKKTRHYLEKYTRMEDFGLDDKKFEILVNDAINYNYHDN